MAILLIRKRIITPIKIMLICMIIIMTKIIIVITIVRR